MKYLFLLLLLGCAEQRLPEFKTKVQESTFLYEADDSIETMWGKRLPFPKPSDEQWVVKGLVAEKQKTKLWCGAASLRILLSAKGRILEQCRIASAYHKSDCCDWKGSGVCNREVSVELAAGRLGYQAVVDNSPSFAEVFSLIQKGKAVAIYHYQGGDTGHSIVAYWAYVSGGVKYILTYDPYYGRRVVMDASWVDGQTKWYRVVYLK